MSFRYPAGLITASSPVNANYPSGVWTPRQALPYLQNNVWGQDPFFDQTVLLLHGDGTNGAQNNTFLDSSSNNFTITRNGNTTQGTFTPFSLASGEWSNYFDGSGDYLTAPSDAAFDFGSGNFTIEAFVNISSATGIKSICSKIFDFGPFLFAIDGTTLKYWLSSTGTSWNIASGVSGGTVSLGSWAHVALVRNGTTVTPYVNGVAGTTTTTSATLVSNTRVLSIGADQTSGSGFVQFQNGYISNLRLVKGTAVYTSNFTPPTAPLTNITNTSLLTCQSNRFVDNSTANSGTGFTITRNGDVRVTAFSPFQPLLAYSPGVTGGSGYFDPTGDYLSISDSSNLASPGSGDFTLAAWIYLPQAISNALGASAFYHLKNDTGTSTTVFIGEISSGGAFNLSTGTALIVAGTAGLVRPGQWNYLVASRVSGTLKTFVNGVEDKSISNSTTYNGSVVQIGAWRYSASDFSINGYISDLRFVKGSGVTSVTVPTAPLTTITNTSLLLNFTNAGIFDNTAKNVLETVGNAQIDTAVVKYGTGSMEFDGNVDYLLGPNSIDFNFGGGDFTIEFWMYASAQALAPICHQTSLASNLGWVIWNYDNLNVNTVTRKLTFMANGASFTLATTSDAYADNTWTHIAVVKSGTGSNNIKIYSNGTAIGTGTYATALANATQPFYVGGIINGVSWNNTVYFNGFIDDLRITKGIARYTANFVPPIARFPNQ